MEFKKPDSKMLKKRKKEKGENKKAKEKKTKKDPTIPEYPIIVINPNSLRTIAKLKEKN